MTRLRSAAWTVSASVVAAAAALTGCSSPQAGPGVVPASAATAVSATTATDSSATTVTPSTSATPTSVAANSLEQAYETVVAQVGPKVVEISTASGLGSGIVYDSSGDIVTNDHVVGSASQFKVTFADGRTLDASLVGTFPADDLAVIKVAGDNLPGGAVLADSTQVKVGEICLAIGNPLGLASSVTAGIVSFNGRTVDEGNGIVLPSTIQTSAPINPGNSGGALVDLRGEVIGIPTLAATDPQLGGGAAGGIGFAIPSNTIKRIADQLVRTGQVTDSGRAALGISAADVNGSTGQPAGVLVHSVDAASAAAQAGISAGDVITQIDGTPTPDVGTLGDLLAARHPNDKVKVAVTHPDGTTTTYDVTLGQLG